jgi:hypothetical protein
MIDNMIMLVARSDPSDRGLRQSHSFCARGARTLAARHMQGWQTRTRSGRAWRKGGNQAPSARGPRGPSAQAGTV